MAGILGAFNELQTNPLFQIGAGLLSQPNFGAGIQSGLQGLQRAQATQSLLQMQQLQQQALQQRMAAQQADAARKERVRGLLGQMTAPGVTEPMTGQAAPAGMLAGMQPELVEYLHETGELPEIIAGQVTPGAGGFEGTSMDAQAYNIWLAGREKIRKGESLTNRERDRFEAAERHLTMPRYGPPDPLTGQPTVLAPPPLPGLSGAPSVATLPQRRAPQNQTRPQTPQARRPGTPLTDAELEEQGLRPGTAARWVRTPGGEWDVDILQGPSAATENAAVSLQSAMDVLDELETMAVGEDGVFVGIEPGLLSRLQAGGEVFWQKLTQEDPRYANYQKLAEGTLAPIIRAFGEKGTLSDTDVKRARALLARLSPLPDSEKVARESFLALRRILLKALEKEQQGMIKNPAYRKGARPVLPDKSNTDIYTRYGLERR